MAKIPISLKRIAIDKATAATLKMVVIASVLIVFSLVGSKALMSQLKYQNKVIDAKAKAADQLKANIKSVSSLVDAYKAFDGSNESVIGTADKNSKIVLDALPSKYDFPALATSLEKLLQGYQINAIGGQDDELAQSATAGSQVVEIPFTISVTGSYESIKKLINDFDRSIRPLHILKITLDGSDASMKIEISAKTYYQAEKTLEITTKEIK